MRSATICDSQIKWFAPIFFFLFFEPGTRIVDRKSFVSTQNNCSLQITCKSFLFPQSCISISVCKALLCIVLTTSVHSLKVGTLVGTRFHVHHGFEVSWNGFDDASILKQISVAFVLASTLFSFAQGRPNSCVCYFAAFRADGVSRARRPLVTSAPPSPMDVTPPPSPVKMLSPPGEMSLSP